ncbi:MAG: Glutamyl/glutaminyl-tRNA synthetase, glutamyl-tRNA synthetase [Candidatus Peregrinibacteria bacterium GW2011_GWF2_43_17]|nr:MAG: Glutamyl/glutaminyl-tRNA synthetase, glutamyl-tRNA synthetase [Candidatus Peregrinibacteria bacterium GW2011_GWF2_43_17]KKT20376.1 MAG: Glutamate-tRNA ligase [Candidatus Peregrinibacteria bacterium GW2011_GWA2_43_8]HAU40269.1 glutamate--tRNA ligase [Candidatus Peregrinibacteria bacterium]
MIKTRFAPSPTGLLHVGGLRTALYSYLFARQNKGEFVLRIEDTDQKRYVEGAVENLLRTLKWFGIEYDEGPYFQSKRTEIYKKHAEALLEKGHAYKCFCTEERLTKMREDQIAKKRAPMYDRACLKLTPEEIEKKISAEEPFVIRQKMPSGGTIKFKDLVRGDMEFDPKTVDDQVLIKSDGFPTYHLANVVDDHLMGITHVIRGEEWLPSTPKHIALYNAFGWNPPTFAHLPLLLNPDKTKLSKRQGDVAAEDYMIKGYLKEAIINFIALLGWNPGTTEEFFSLEDLIKKFSIERVQKAGAVFNLEKLDWLNGHYLRSKTPEDLAKLILPRLQTKWFEETAFADIEEKNFDDPDEKTIYFLKAVKTIQTRLKTLAEAPDMLKFFLIEEPPFDLALLLNEKMKVDKETATKALEESKKDLATLTEFTLQQVQETLTGTIKRLGLKNGQVLWPLRVALTGEQYSPGTFEVIESLGKERTMKRIDLCLDKLQ